MISESKFHMWRTVFAVAHADHRVTPEEKQYMLEIIERLPLSNEQSNVLIRDVTTAQDAAAMFERITNTDDREEFFRFANKMVNVDGVQASAELQMMQKLKQMHMRDLDFDRLVGQVPMELEEEKKLPRYMTEKRVGGWRGILKDIKETFFGD